MTRAFAEENIKIEQIYMEYFVCIYWKKGNVYLADMLHDKFVRFWVVTILIAFLPSAFFSLIIPSSWSQKLMIGMSGKLTLCFSKFVLVSAHNSLKSY